MIRASVLALVVGLASPVLAQTPTPDTLFAAAQLAHGGAAVTSVDRIRLTGRSRVDDGDAQPITITAGLDGRLRVDYGDPLQRSIVTTTSGSSEIHNGKKTAKPAHDGAYSQLDLLTVFGIRHLALAASRTTLAPGSINARATYRVRAATGREIQPYGRRVRDEADIDFDSQNGLVAAITRQQYGADSLDLAFEMRTVFSDYRRAGDFVLPFRIERYVNGRLRETIAIGVIEINPAFPTDLFAR